MATSAPADAAHGIVQYEEGASPAGIATGAAPLSEKEPVQRLGNLSIEEFDDETEQMRATTKSTKEDFFNMQRMGKKQEFIRQFRLISTISFVCIATAAWEIGIFFITPGLVDGGTPGLLYSVIWCWIGFGPIYLSMAEMSSMAPISGAQYHWVSEFAPESIQKELSYAIGWVSTLAWQAGNCLGVFLTGTQIQTMILIANENYAFPNYQGTLLVWAAVVMTYIGSVYGARILPHWQNAVFTIHILAFFGLMVPIWVNAPKLSAEAVFTDFRNYGGWQSMTLAVMVGQLTGVAAQVGIDTAAHMSEDVRNAGRAVPIVMISVYCVNFFLILTAFVTLSFALTDLDAALEDLTTYPAVWVMRQSMAKGWVLVIMALIVFLGMCGNISYMAAVTRDLFAFARDNGLPFSSWISKVHPRRHVPANGALVTCTFAVLLSLIYIGSPVAFYAITSLSTVALLQCYMTSIGCVLWRRIYRPETLPPAQFSLGRWGIPINAAAVGFCLWGFFWAFWPVSANPSAADFNWSSPIYGAVLIIAAVWYAFRGRHDYKGPVTTVVGRGVRE